jgi:hypothetical protein
MKMHEFSIIASGMDPEAEGFESHFFDAGCDDATISFQKGRIIADFAREADTLEEAISSAIENVRLAGAKIDRVEPDPLVSLADMAARTGVTRAAMTNYAQGKRGIHFPAPVARITSESPLWEWATVARWMYQNNKLAKQIAVDAELVRQANAAISAGEIHVKQYLEKVAEDYAAELEAA